MTHPAGWRSPRIIGAQYMRDLALHDATDLERSRALLAELAVLLRTYTIRAEQCDAEVVSQISASALRQWWFVHHTEIAETQRHLARALLSAAGVRTQEPG